MQKITTFLWFDTQAEEAARYYVSVFGGDSEVLDVTHYNDAVPDRAGTAMTVRFRLAGQEYVALNGGPQFPFTEAVSLAVDCASQEETDVLWAELTKDGEEGRCGWLKDRYGLSWQLVPRGFTEVMADPDPARAQRATAAMMGMRKLDLEALRNA
ncbi:VOC family protein [Streptomyces sp. NPDC058195]|uniref:VOC family protein n=1 Tax=Streptomyces sp. NPDC058195 TaxID=3346375 RepID=UPI0036E5E346